MQKWTGLLLILIVLLAACSTGSVDEISNNNQQKKAKAEQSENKGAVDKSYEEERNSESKKTEKTSTSTDVKEPLDPMYELSGNWSFEPIKDANPKVALLTIDDAPDQHAVEMAKTLKEMNAPAIFFVNGHFIDTAEEKEKLKKIHEMGFAIGNHTNSHASLPDLTREQQKEEIIGLSKQIEQITGEKPKFFRAPFGQNTDYSEQIAAEEGMLVMNWTYGYDWNQEYMNANSLADIMVNTNLLNNGANLLMHDREWTYKALPDIVSGLRDKGYELLDPSLIKTP